MTYRTAAKDNTAARNNCAVFSPSAMILILLDTISVVSIFAVRIISFLQRKRNIQRREMTSNFALAAA